MSNTTIAKNAIFLYIRTILTIFISLYSSRILLQILGVEDFGLYNLIGGIVAIFTSLRIFLSNAIQRFINYERGQGNLDKVRVIFNIGLYIHKWVAVIFFVICEVAGLLLIGKLNIDPDRLYAAYWTFQLSILTTIVSILAVPYDALIIANERMDFFAMMSIAEAVLKLCIIYIVSIIPFDRLIFYAFLFFLVCVFIRCINIIYCKMSFAESRAMKCHDKKLMRNMITFAGWNICGNLGYSLMHEGVNFILNLFGGVIVNAAKGITYQILSAVNTLIGNVSIAFKPQINSVYGSGNHLQFYNLLIYNGKILFASYIIIVVPLFIFVPQILHFWLESVPVYTIEFVRAIMFYGLIRSLHSVMNSYYDSVGQMKYYQLCELCFMIINIPIAYLLLSRRFPFWSVFIAMGILELMNFIAIIIIAVHLYKFNYKIYIRGVIFPYIKMIVCAAFIICVIFPYAANVNNIVLVLMGCAVLILVMLACSFFLIFNNEERKSFMAYVLQRLKRV